METALLCRRIPSLYLRGLFGLAIVKTNFFSGMYSWDTAELPCRIMLMVISFWVSLRVPPEMSWGNGRRAIIFFWWHVEIAEKSEEMKFWETVGFRCCTFFFFFTAPWGMQDLSSLTRYEICAPLHWKQSLNLWMVKSLDAVPCNSHF